MGRDDVVEANTRHGGGRAATVSDCLAATSPCGPEDNGPSSFQSILYPGMALDENGPRRLPPSGPADHVVESEEAANLRATAVGLRRRTTVCMYAPHASVMVGGTLRAAYGGSKE